MSKLCVVSYNVNSIRSNERIHAFLVELKRLKADILYLIDTRLTEGQNQYLKNHITGFKVFSNTVDDRGRGVSILIKDTLKIDVLDKFQDQLGNFLLLKVRYDHVDYILAAVYGSSSPSLEFYDDIYERCFSFGCENILLGGDWNVTLEYDKDARGYEAQRNLANTRKIIQKNDYFSLTDVYRYMHPNRKQYSWIKPNHNKRGRLDYFFCTPGILACINHSEIMTLTPFSDHAPIRLVYDFHGIILGKGYWRMQTGNIKAPALRVRELNTLKETYGTYVKTANTDNYLLNCTPNEREIFMAKSYTEIQEMELSINPTDFLIVLMNNLRT